jgi:hypothetical protein
MVGALSFFINIQYNKQYGTRVDRMNVLNKYLQIICLGNNRIGLLTDGMRIIVISDQSVKERIEKTGSSDTCGFVGSDAVKMLSKKWTTAVECSLFLAIADARKLGIISDEDEIVFQEPAIMN